MKGMRGKERKKGGKKERKTKQLAQHFAGKHYLVMEPAKALPCNRQ
jgi:hypothetical protein